MRLRPGSLGLPAVLSLFLLAVLIVNPLRDMPVHDDWAYAEMVRHLLDTGHYRLNDWLAPNCPFETLWGALFCRVGGTSYGALRISTIVLSVAGLAAFRELALEHRIGRPAANLLTLLVATSPLFFKMSLTFMTDVPFVATTTVALFLYTRALRQDTWPLWIAASLACAAAILTRQIGAALLGALAVVWLRDAKRIERLPRYVAGAAIPLAATLWQVSRGLGSSTWATAYNLAHTRSFLHGAGFWEALPWRPAAIVEYMAWYLLPLALGAGVAIFLDLRKRGTDAGAPTGSPTEAPRGAASADRDVRATPRAVLLWGLFFVACRSYGAYVLDARSRMPFLRADFLVVADHRPLELAATLATIAGAAALAPLFVRRYRLAAARPARGPEELLDATALFLLVSSLVFWQFFDRYLLVFLPYAAIVIGRQVEDVLVTRARILVPVCLALFVATVVWTREGLCRDEAVWTLAERLHASGVATEAIAIAAPTVEWEWVAVYHFEDYAREAPASVDPLDFYTRYVRARREQARFLVVSNPEPPKGERWEVVDRASYFSLFESGAYYAVRRERKPSGAI